MRTDLPQLGARLSCVDVPLDRQSAQSRMLTRTAVATARKHSSWRNGFSTSPSFWAVASRISRKDIISDLKSSVPPSLPSPLLLIPFLLPLHSLLSPLPPPLLIHSPSTSRCHSRTDSWPLALLVVAISLTTTCVLKSPSRSPPLVYHHLAHHRLLLLVY
jgi:hypothetical protein